MKTEARKTSDNLWRSRPERALFAVSSAVTAVAAAVNHKRSLRIAKPLIGASLSIEVLRGIRSRPVVDSALLLGATTASLAGDVTLQQPQALGEDRKKSGRKLNQASGAFGLAHLCYQIYAWRHGARPDRTLAIAHGVAVCGTALQAAVIEPRVLPAAGAYGGVLATTSVLASSSLVGRDPALENAPILGARKPVSQAAFAQAPINQRRAFAFGAGVFVLSDFLILSRRFYLRGAFARGLAEGAVMMTYAAAQRWIIDALMAIGPVPPAQKHVPST